MPLMPGAEPYRHDGGEIGVLLCHGFTGSPQSMRPWGEYLAERGLTVSLPLLPGHGTRWQDMQVTGWQDWYAEADRALRELTDRCSRVFVCGLSMGGTLALRLAARHGAEISGLVLVNPSVKADSPKLKAVSVLRHAVPSVKGIASDIATARSRPFCSSRTFPGQGYARRRPRSSEESRRFGSAVSAESRARNASAIVPTSSKRSRSGGMRIGMTLTR